MALGGWSGEKIEITISLADVESDLTDFPINLILSASAGINDKDLTAIFTEIGSDVNRKKIAVAQADDTTECYVEIERWDNVNKKASLHVKVPSISSTLKTVLYLYVDSSHANNTAYVGDSGDAVAENVWDSNFKSVYHFSQDPNGTPPELTDSTSNDKDGTDKGFMHSGQLVDAGVDLAQKAWDFDSSNDNVDVGIPLVIGASQDFTIEVFMKPSFVSRTFFTTARGASPAPSLRGRLDATGKIYMEGRDSNGDDYNITGPSSGVDYHHHVWMREGAIAKVAVDASGLSTSSWSSLSYDNGDNTLLGDPTSPQAGPMVEARISSIARPAAWCKATYKTLYDAFVGYDAGTQGDMFVSLSSLEVEGGGAIGGDISLPALTLEATAGIAGDIIVSLPTLVMIGDRKGDLAASLPLLESTGASGWTGEVHLPILSGYSEAYIDHIEIANVTLPSLKVEMISGASAIVELEPLSLAASGLHAYPYFGDSILPALTVAAVPGMLGDVDLGAVTFTGSGLQGVVGGVNDFLPNLIIDAYLNIVQHGTIDVRMKRLLVEAAATVGSAYNLSLIYPRLTLQIEAVFGTIGSIDTNLPAIKESGMNSYNDIRGNMTGSLGI